MPSIASHLGLPLPGDAPRGVCLTYVLRPGEELPSDVLYIGHSHFSHRLPTAKWQCPFLVGRDGSQEHVAFLVFDWFPKSALFSKLRELRHKRLASDCAASELCHGDILVGMFAQHCPKAKTSSASAPARAVILAMAAGTEIPSAVSCAVPQSSVVSAPQGLLFGPSAQHFHWPYIEDLINDPLATSYSEWLSTSNFSNHGCLGPSVHGVACVMTQRAGTADQSTSVNKKTALPPLIPFGCTADDHFGQSLFVQRHGTPLDWSAA